MARTVVRVSKRQNPYVMLDKYFLSDGRLTWKAKGMLAYLLSKPDDWIIILDDLIKKSSDGRDSVKAGLRELEKMGYIIREQQRQDNGTFGDIKYIIHERPQILDNRTADGFSVNGLSVNGKPVNGKSTTTNNDLTNNNITKQQLLQHNKNDNNDKPKNKDVVVVVLDEIDHKKVKPIANPDQDDTVNAINKITGQAKSLDIPLTEKMILQLYNAGDKNVERIISALKAADQWRRGKAKKREKVHNWSGVLIEAVTKQWQPGPEDINFIPKSQDEGKYGFLYEC